ncbi:MAG: 3-oxoacyl-ACP reductase FabG [Bordetella sp.]|nr:MAG: 3-oxoacyl-ACP reductase FabG [Bordetella sp.]
MKLDLSNKIAFVTGATRGIGKTTAEELAKRGAVVIGTSTSIDGANSITKNLSSYGGKGVVLDVTDAQACELLINKIQKENSGPHILINNAGITSDSLMMRMSDKDWDSVIETNLSSVFRISRSVLRGMLKNRWGRIINITSVVGFNGNRGQVNYAAAKAGISGMSKALVRELGNRNITVNCIAPGFIDTDMTRSLNSNQLELLIEKIPLGRLGTTNDIAQAVTFLASEESSYITGTTLHVNGGMYL